MSPRIFVLLCLIVGVLVGVYAAQPLPLDIGISVTDFGEVIAALVMVAFLIERSLDVFLTIWRAQGSEEFTAQVQQLKKKMNSTDGGTAADAKALEKTMKEHAVYRSKTRHIALWFGLFLGIVLSGIGFRFLYELVNPERFALLATWQKNTFIVIDVLFTGAMLSGGSDQLHKVMDLIRTVTDASSRKAQGNE